MSQRYKAKRRQRYYVQRKVCQRCGKTDAIECRLSSWEKSVEDVLCPECTRRAGYCCCCGIFWAGVTSFDMRGSGLCDHCQDQVDADFAEPDPDEREMCEFAFGPDDY